MAPGRSARERAGRVPRVGHGSRPDPAPAARLGHVAPGPTVRPGPRPDASRGRSPVARRWGVGGGLRPLRLPSVVPPVPAPSFAVLATASPDATTTPRPSASPSPSPTPLSLDLTWTQLPLDEQSPRLAWIGDRFVLADVKSGAVRTSTDGQDWQALQPGDAAQGYVDLLRGSFASWQDSAVGWWNPQDRDGPEIAGAPPITDRDVLQIVRPPAAPDFDDALQGPDRVDRHRTQGHRRRGPLRPRLGRLDHQEAWSQDE